MVMEIVGKLIAYKHVFILKNEIRVRLICYNLDARCYRVH